MPVFVTLSARTNANMVQEQVDGRLDKRRKGVYGPPMGRKAIVFVDDLNMPSKETYGAQPPIELLRQGLDQGGWYGRDNAFRALTDVQFVAAMGPPGGGRTFVTNRYLRHFNVLALAQVRARAAQAQSLACVQTWPASARGYMCMHVAALRARSAGQGIIALRAARDLGRKQPICARCPLPSTLALSPLPTHPPSPPC